MAQSVPPAAMPPVRAVERRGGKFLIFRLEDHDFAIPVLQVREILALHHTHPSSPDFGEAIDSPWLLGIARIENKERLILNVDQALSAGEVEGLNLVRGAEA